MENISSADFTPIIGIPDYVHRCIRPIIVRKRIELRAIRDSRCDMLPEESFAAVICTVGKRKYRYIEVPNSVNNAYYANCALLHEIGHLCTKKIFWMPTYRREIKAWKHAERLRNKIGFSKRDPITGMSWDEAKECSLSSYKGAKLKKSDFVGLVQSVLLRYFFTVSMICLVLFGLLWLAQAISSPNGLNNSGWQTNIKDIATTSSVLGIFKTFKYEKKHSFQRFAARWNSQG